MVVVRHVVLREPDKMFLQRRTLVTDRGWAVFRPILILSSAGEASASISKYAGGSFTFGDGVFPEVKALWSKALMNF